MSEIKVGDRVNYKGDAWLSIDPDAVGIVRTLYGSPSMQSAIVDFDDDSITCFVGSLELVTDEPAADVLDDFNRPNSSMTATAVDMDKVVLDIIHERNDKEVEYERTIKQQAAEIERLRGENEDQKREMEARHNILDRAVAHKERLFPDEFGNSWMDSIDRLARGIEDLRGELETERGKREAAEADAAAMRELITFLSEIHLFDNINDIQLLDRIDHALNKAHGADLLERLEKAERERDAAKKALEGVKEIAEEAQGDWSEVTETYAPRSMQGYKEIVEAAADALK